MGDRWAFIVTAGTDTTRENELFEVRDAVTVISVCTVGARGW